MMKKWIMRASAVAATVPVLLIAACSRDSNDATTAPEVPNGLGAIEGTVTGASGSYLFEGSVLDPYPQSPAQEPPDYTATLTVTKTS